MENFHNGSKLILLLFCHVKPLNDYFKFDEIINFESMELIFPMNKKSNFFFIAFIVRNLNNF